MIVTDKTEKKHRQQIVPAACLFNHSEVWYNEQNKVR